MSLPAGRVDVVTAALPLVTVAVPIVVAPLVNVTVPVVERGSVAISVTAWLTEEGFTEEVSVMAGVALLTTWVRLADAALLLESPL